jgi:hypothetical protein
MTLRPEFMTVETTGHRAALMSAPQRRSGARRGRA